MTTDQLIDQKTFAQLKDLDTPGSGFLQGLLEMFAGQGIKLINEINQAIADNNPTRLHQSAHTLKGASLNMGATALGNLCLKLEQFGKSGTIPPDAVALQPITVR